MFPDFSKKLKDVFPVGRLQPRDFLEARRGLENYLEDLRNGTISIRDYEFGKNGVSEVRRTHPLDERHRGEFAFHIVRYLMLNSMKLKYGENRLYPILELEKGMDELLGEVSQKHLDNFRHLTRLKEQRSMAFPEWTATIITDICCRVISGIVDMTRAEHLKVAQFHDVPSTMFLKVSIPISLVLLSEVDSIS